MKKEIAEAWVKDLRTNPPQATGVLYDGFGHCCLGRLCLLLGGEFKPEYRKTKYYAYLNGENTHDYEVMPLGFVALAGMRSQSGMFAITNECGDEEQLELSDLNDGGRTFDEISDIIEKNWEKL